VKNSGKRIK